MNYSFEQFFKDKKKSGNSKVREASDKLWNSYHQIKKKIEHNLVVIHRYFPSYSLCNRKHSEMIVSQIENMLGKEHWNTITIADVWMFLCCAYIYDIGSMIFENEWRVNWETDEFQSFLKECVDDVDSSIRNAAECIMIERPKSEESPFALPITIQRNSMILRAEFYRRKPKNRIEKAVELKLQDFLKDSLSLEEGAVSQIQRQIAKISSMCEVDFKYMLEQLPFQDNLLEVNYHPRLVAALLRVGDLCDFDHERFDIRWIQANGGLTDINFIHYYKHQSVVNKYISSEEINVILDFDFDSMKKKIAEERIGGIEKIEQTKEKKDRAFQHDFCNRVVVETNHWFDWLEDELKKIKFNWEQIGGNDIPMFHPTLHKKIRINNEEAIFGDKKMQFNLQSQNVYRFIESYVFYDDQLLFVRELIQNSLDALKLKFWHQLREGIYDRQIYKNSFNCSINENGEMDYSKLQPFDFIDCDIYEDYEVRIVIEHQEGEKTAKFIIEDNGIGICMEDLSSKIVKTANRWSKKENNQELDGIPAWLYPTGAFGIGIHSAFSLSDCIYIQTKPENDKKTYEITLHSGKKDGYVFVSVCNETVSFCRKKGSGTRIEVTIDIEKYKNQNNEYEDDPFIEHPKSKICFDIENKIKHLCHTPLFQIKYTCQKVTKTIPSLSKSEAFGLLFRKEKQNILFDTIYYKSGERYDFVLEEYGRVILVWDREQAIAFRFTFYEIQRIICCCKGILIQNAAIENVLPWINIECMDLLGKKSEETITVTRDNIKWEYQEKLKKRLWDCNRWIAGIYKELLLRLYYNEWIQKWLFGLEEQLQQYQEISVCEFPNDFVSELEPTFLKGFVNYNIEKSIKKLIYNRRILYFVPFYQIIWMILVVRENKEIKELYPLIKDKRISFASDLNKGYECIDKSNISKILNAESLEIPCSMFEHAQKKLPYLKYIPCDCMLYRKKEIVLSFDMTNKSKRAIQIFDIFLLKEYIKNGTRILPAFLAYKESAVDKIKRESPILTNNYYLILWSTFDKIQENIGYVKEEKEKIIENLMNEVGEDGKRVKNIIEYIYRNKAYKIENETYNETRKKIRNSYKKLIADILDCIWLSDEELKERKPGLYIV